MQSYMAHLMMEGWKSHWFDPDSRKVILTYHVARMFGCQECQGIKGFLLINDSWLMRCLINVIMPLKESMPHDAFTDMYWWLHFSDYFDDDKEWINIFFDMKHELPETT
jgi:hypothetical protein